MLDATSSFKAVSDIQMNLKPSTRFSATPQWKDTFVHFHMDQKSSGFISEQDRFRKTTNSLHIKNQFQQDDKAKRDKLFEGRVNVKRDKVNAFDNKAFNNDVVFDAHDQNRLNRKAAMYQNYERTCHSKVI